MKLTPQEGPPLSIDYLLEQVIENDCDDDLGKRIENRIGARVAELEVAAGDARVRHVERLACRHGAVGG